jgi:uncharacterized phage protein (TIGR02218 family)
MTFNQREISNEEGQPVGLYYLKWGNTEWAYTSADRDLTYGVDRLGNPLIYKAVAISDQGMVQGGDQGNDMTVDIPADLPIVALFRSTPPANSIFFTIRRWHPGEPDAPIYWKGTVGNVARPDIANAQIIGRSLLATFKRTGLRLVWSRGCPHFLYDQNCRVNREDYRVDAEIIGITGNTFRVAPTGQPMGWFDGGLFEWEANEDGTRDLRGIERQIAYTPPPGNPPAEEFVIFGSSDRLQVGMVIAMYPGCDLTKDTCIDKFNNRANYGGVEFLPGVSPFDGNPVF